MAGDDIWVLVPVTFFLSIALIVGLVMYFRAARIRAETEGGGEYKRLAEEAVRGQKALLDQIERMNTTLREIEQLLRQV